MDELVRAQKRLGQSLERASIGEDRELASEVREKGESFANLLFGTLRMTRIYDLNNDTFDRPLGEIRNLLEWLINHLGVVHLVTVEDQIYLNDVRIRFVSGSTTVQLGTELRRHNVGSISFHRVVEKPDLLELLAGLGGQPAESERRAAICRRLAERQIGGIELGGVNRYLQANEERPKTDWDELLARAVELVEETWNNLASGRLLNPLTLRRVVVELMSAGLETPGLWVEPTGTEHGRHAVRVLRVALAIGAEAGLTDRTLQDLGIAALVHDVGYALIGGGAAEKPSVKEHLAAGVKVMLAQRGFHAAKIHRILGILYHHHNYKDVKEVPSLFGRILRIAEDLDNLVHRGGMTPPTALSSMLGAAGTAYDPTLIQITVNRLGRFPPGTAVELEDGQHATVVSLARGGNFERPIVMLPGGRLIDTLESSRIARVIER
jgi:HD-GYP domain-containing protein (c-di-GMP phosphodiesterase class II)